MEKTSLLGILFCLLSPLANVSAEVPQVDICPGTNVVGHCEFYVAFDKMREATNSCSVFVFVSARQRADLPRSMYVELWKDDKYHAALIASPMEQRLVPGKFKEKAGGGVCFWLDVDRSLLNRSWASLQLGRDTPNSPGMGCADLQDCVIRFSDWYRE